MEINNNKFTLDDIERGLRTIPQLIAFHGSKVAEARESKDIEKLQLEVAKSKSILRNNELKESEKKAQSIIDTEEQAVSLIQAEKDLAIEEIKLEQQVNCFTAIRKQAAFTLHELENQKDTYEKPRV